LQWKTNRKSYDDDEDDDDGELMMMVVRSMTDWWT